MPPTGFEPAIPTGERLQTHPLDRSAYIWHYPKVFQDTICNSYAIRNIINVITELVMSAVTFLADFSENTVEDSLPAFQLKVKVYGSSRLEARTPGQKKSKAIIAFR
jgi:hypothetical protein